MPKKPVVKNDLSNAIAELRRRLGHSQQSFSNMLSLSLGAVARWELNSRPDRKLHERLIALAYENGHRDLGNVLYRDYRLEYELKAEVSLAMDMGLQIRQAISLANQLPPKSPEQREVWEKLTEKLRALERQTIAVVKELDAATALAEGNLRIPAKKRNQQK